MRRRAGRVPLLLLLEDAHWIDPLSLELAGAISRAAPTMPLLLMMTYRPPDTGQPASSPIGKLRNAREINLQEFSESEATLLIRERLQLAFGPQANISREFVDALVARAGGNPFYLEELINYLQYRAISPADSNAFQSLELPASLASLVLARIDRLSPQQQTTIRVASVIGREFRADWLQAACPEIGSAEQVNQHLEVLAQLDLTPLNAEQPYRTYLFKHKIIQEVAYQSVAFALRSQLHEQFAGWLEQERRKKQFSRFVGLPLWQGPKPRKAARVLSRKRAMPLLSRYANAASIQYHERLLDLLEPAEEAPVLIALAAVLVRTGDWKAAEARYLRAIDLAKRQQNRRVHAEAQLGFGKLQRAQGDKAAAAATLEKARDEFAALGDFAGSFDSSTELAVVSGLRGDGRKAMELMEESLHKAEREGDAQRIAHALYLMGNITAMVGMVMYGKEDIAGARPWWLRSLERQEALGNKFAVAALSSNLAFGGSRGRRARSGRGARQKGNCPVSRDWVAVAIFSCAPDTCPCPDG